MAAHASGLCHSGQWRERGASLRSTLVTKASPQNQLRRCISKVEQLSGLWVRFGHAPVSHYRLWQELWRWSLQSPVWNLCPETKGHIIWHGTAGIIHATCSLSGHTDKYFDLCRLSLCRYVGPRSSLSGNWFRILYISVQISSSRKFWSTCSLHLFVRPVDGFFGFIIFNLLQLQVSYKSTILMHDGQPQGTERLKKEEQIDLEFHRDKRKSAGWGGRALKKVRAYGLEEKLSHPVWNVPSSS